MESELTMDLKSLMEYLVETVGPLFIVFDENSDWFSGSGDRTPCARLFAFCDDILRELMKVRRVYIVMSGYSGVLQLVKDGTTAPSNRVLDRPIIFRRLSLHVLRPTEIEEVLRNTQVRRGSSKTMLHRWGLTTDKDVAEAAQYLLIRSSSNPWVLINLLMTYPTYEFLKKEKYPELSFSKRKGLHREQRRYRPQLQEWLIEGKRVELTETIDDIENERVTPGRISRCCRLGWEGTQENAKLFTPPEIKHEIATVVFPLCDYVTYITEILGYLSPDINGVFLWMCLKRWSELFSESSEPKDKLPALFKEGTIFGEYDSVHFSVDIAVLPRIRPGTRCGTLVYASLIDDAEAAYAKH
ncbi:hypothetical protein PRIC1_008338 [Phytophthora ramorum]